MVSHAVREEDGASLFLLEDGSGSVLLEVSPAEVQHVPISIVVTSGLGWQ